jgi:hypothetical protein
MSLTIYPLSVQIVKQDLNVTPSAKDKPFIYSKADIDLTDITLDQLQVLDSECFKIKDRLITEIVRRAKSV